MAEDQLVQHFVFGPFYFAWFVLRLNQTAGDPGAWPKVFASGFGTIFWAVIVATTGRLLS